MLHYIRGAALHEHGKGIENGIAWNATLGPLASLIMAKKLQQTAILETAIAGALLAQRESVQKR